MKFFFFSFLATTAFRTDPAAPRTPHDARKQQQSSRGRRHCVWFAVGVRLWGPVGRPSSGGAGDDVGRSDDAIAVPAAVLIDCCAKPWAQQSAVCSPAATRRSCSWRFRQPSNAAGRRSCNCSECPFRDAAARRERRRVAAGSAQAPGPPAIAHGPVQPTGAGGTVQALHSSGFRRCFGWKRAGDRATHLARPTTDWRRARWDRRRRSNRASSHGRSAVASVHGIWWRPGSHDL